MRACIGCTAPTFHRPIDRPESLAQRRHLTRPITSARVLVGHRRSPGSDLSLATILAAVAGAANAGGFFALGQYTSHMTGYLSQLADNLVLGNLWVSLIAVLAIGAFVTVRSDRYLFQRHGSRSSTLVIL